jgi:hypothetical protein
MNAAAWARGLHLDQGPARQQSAVLG